MSFDWQWSYQRCQSVFSAFATWDVLIQCIAVFLALAWHLGVLACYSSKLVFGAFYTVDFSSNAKQLIKTMSMSKVSAVVRDSLSYRGKLWWEITSNLQVLDAHLHLGQVGVVNLLALGTPSAMT